MCVYIYIYVYLYLYIYISSPATSGLAARVLLPRGSRLIKGER